MELKTLPAELRLKIWSTAAESRVAILNDLVEIAGAYHIPTVTQLCAESRLETRDGYEPVGRGSYFHFSKDILVTDHNFVDQYYNPTAESIAPQVERVVFWDCVPDEPIVAEPQKYSDYLEHCYGQKRWGQIKLDEFWFPNIKDFWVVKVGHIEDVWAAQIDKRTPQGTRTHRMAHEFRYWVGKNIIEIAPFDFQAPDNVSVLCDGRCSKDNCKVLNRGRPHFVSKITFMDGPYRKPKDGRNWQRITPPPPPHKKESDRATFNRIQWAFIERALTFSLRHDWSEEPEGPPARYHTT